ncbi:MAG: bifunctional helix-turn-helix transcriptional regulator/GNAT family N-acetyltransferase [Kofleriaceae bacterium]
MIVRSWTATTTRKHAAAYRAHLEQHVLPGLRALDGFAGAALLTRELGREIELVVQTRWRSRDAVRAFAGDDLGKAVVEPAAREVLTRFDERAEHHDVVTYGATVTPAGPSRITAVREFNRFYTAKIGVLDDRHLHSAFSLGEVRVLFELAHRATTTATELAGALDLDAGYLSRVITRLVDQALVQRKPAPEDARERMLALTAKGKKAFAELDARAGAAIADVLATAPEHDQARAVAAMATIIDALEGSGRDASVELRDLKPGDLGWIVQRHGELYAAEYGWSGEFEALVATIVGKFAEHRDPTRERAWIAERAGQRLGCIMVVAKSAKVAQLRLLLVEPAARGLGIGGALVAAVVDVARAAGYAKLSLWTQSALGAAAAIYRRAGFAVVKSAPHHSFGADLVEQVWERAL